MCVWRALVVELLPEQRDRKPESIQLRQEIVQLKEPPVVEAVYEGFGASEVIEPS